MTNLHDGQIADLLNNGLRYNPETIAMGYAIREEKRRIMALAARTRLLSAIDTLDEWTLDYLAVELRTPAYRESYPLDVKRKLIAGTIPFYAHLGTPASVNLIINAIFSGGHIEEWFEYNGQPHHFRVDIDLTGRTTALAETEEMMLLVDATKRLTSWLDEIHYVAEASAPALLRLGGAMAAVVTFPIPEQQDNFEFEDAAHIGGASAIAVKVPIPEQPDTFSFEHSIREGGSAAIVANIPIPEQPDHLAFRSEMRMGGANSVIMTTPVAEQKEE